MRGVARPAADAVISPSPSPASRCRLLAGLAAHRVLRPAAALAADLGLRDRKHLVLPAVTLATILLPNFVLITRTAILELMGEQFCVSPALQGMSRPRVLVTTSSPNAINPVLSFLGIQLGLSWRARSSPRRSSPGRASGGC
jgi:ABC-type dipeptide/oligopeptide/nickel transport system permease component